MKKVLLGIFTVLTVLLFSDKVSASLFDVPSGVSCMYRSGIIKNENGEYENDFSGEVVTFTGNSVMKYITKGFEVNGKKLEPGYNSEAGLMKLANHNMWFSWMGGVDRGDPHTCYKFLVLDENSGMDDYYVADTIEETYKLGEKIDAIFKLIDPYEDSKSNAILDEMYCTYSGMLDSPLALGHISFKIKHDHQGNGSYEIMKNHHEVLKTGTIEHNFLGKTTSTMDIDDYFSIRVFWDPETKSYRCPDSIRVGKETVVSNDGFDSNVDTRYEFGYNPKQGDINTTGTDVEGFWSWDRITTRTFFDEMALQQNASYIKYKVSTPNQGNICNYTRTGNEDWYIALQQISDAGEKNYITYFNETLGYSKNVDSNSIPFDIIMKDDEKCSGLPYIYTDCLNTSSSKCKVSQEPFEVIDSTGRNLVEKLGTNDWLNSQSWKDAQIGMGEFNGYEYKNLICELKPRIELFSTPIELRKTNRLDIYKPAGESNQSYNILDLPCNEWGALSKYKCDDEECKSDLEYQVNKSITNVLVYCQATNKKVVQKNNNDTVTVARYNECKSFEAFYASLVENGIIKSFLNDCDIFEGEMKGKIIYIINIIKIAGPILAIILGMIDFTKVLASGDADKEMKTAWKNFKVRLFAAFLLFIIPILISMLLNAFIGDKINYNPFCGVLDTNEKE